MRQPGENVVIQAPPMTASSGRADPELSIPSRALVLYHAGCKDGFCAAWVARRALDQCELVPVSYGDDPPKNVKNRIVFILDFSFKRDVLERMIDEAKTLIVLDHHITAQKELEGLRNCFFDMNRSGAGMAWDHLYPGNKRPWLVDYVEDRDLWRFALPNSKLVNAYIQSLRYDFGVWDWVNTGVSLPDAMVRGEVVENFQTQYSELVRDVQLVFRDFCGVPNVPIVNISQSGVSETLDFMINHTGASMAMAWRHVKGERLSFSLRSRGDRDVSEIAKYFGGGGHKNASGFELRGDNALSFLGWVLNPAMNTILANFWEKHRG